jgi:hypothetical protein
MAHIARVVAPGIPHHITPRGNRRHGSGNQYGVSGIPVGDGTIGPVTRKVRQLYQDVIRGRTPKYKHWLAPVY